MAEQCSYVGSGQNSLCPDVEAFVKGLEVGSSAFSNKSALLVLKPGDDDSQRHICHEHVDFKDDTEMKEAEDLILEKIRIVIGTEILEINKPKTVTLEVGQKQWDVMVTRFQYGTCEHIFQVVFQEKQDENLEKVMFQKIFGNLPMGAYMTTTGGEIRYINPAVAKMLGYESEDELKNRLAEKGAAALYADMSIREKQIERLQANKRDTSEFQMIKKDGTRIWVRDTTELVNDAIYGALEDITDEKESKREMELLWQAIDMAPFGVTMSVQDEEGNWIIERVNPAQASMYGASAGDLIGKPVAIFAGGEISNTKGQRFQKTFRRNRMNRDKDGEEFPVALTSMEMVFDGKKHRVTICEDMTKEEQISILLLDRTKDLETVLKSIGEGVGRVDADNNFIFGNCALKKIFGMMETENIGNIKRFLADEKDYEEIIIPEDEKRKKGEKSKYTVRIKRKNTEGNTEIRIIEITATPSCNEVTKDYEGAFVVIQDVTEREQMREDLEKTKISAEDANRAKSDFLAKMTHELRTPMNAIIGFTELMKNTELTDQQKELLNHIYCSGNILIFLINDILDTSKIESGAEFVLTEKNFNLRETLEKIEALFTLFLKIQEKPEVKFKSKIEDIPKEVRGDEMRLIQILNNLLSNAVKFTEKGSITLKVERDDNGPEGKISLRFSVTDTGMGIPLDSLRSIFQPYKQGENHVTQKHGGTGLGLCITKQLIERMGGHIDVMSELEKGTTFLFSVPFSPTVEEKKKGLCESRETLRCPLNILVADDNLINQKLIKNLLESHGHNVEIVSNGTLAVQAYTKGQYDLIFMDIQMPEMNGIEATKEIRAQEKETGRHIPIIALTANTTKEDVKTYMEIGMNGTVSKPINIDVLMTEMRKQKSLLLQTSTDKA